MRATLIATTLCMTAPACGRMGFEPLDDHSEGADAAVPDRQLDLLTRRYDFASDLGGFLPGFSDYVAGLEDSYEMVSGFRALPAPLDSSRGGLMVGGNHSGGDLFMYMRKRIDGLAPNTEYALDFEIDFATATPDPACPSIGGGGNIPVRVGASPIEPTPARVHVDYLDPDKIDKGENEADGADAIVIGSLSKGLLDCDGETFLAKKLRSAAAHKTLTRTTAADGSLWIFAGNDATWDPTTVYYTTVYITLKPTR